MTDDYVRAKIRDALAATDGNRHDAQKLLITWAVRDPSLLLGMTKPHLKAIATALIEHISRERKQGEDTDSGPDHFSKSAIDDMVASASRRRPAGKRPERSVPPPKSTERQATTMRRIAAAFTKKKDK
ncbi:MAG: hypothetical protein SFW62_06540 [Alphaproteobacteria bacterium]|nr:hypothetical protein [Alphaproteobacteria bacterium]